MAQYIVSSGVTSTGIALNYDSMYVRSGGTANSTTVIYCGSMYVSSGGTANDTTVNSCGRMYVSSGGTASSIKENGGYVGVYGGAEVTFLANSFSGLRLSAAATLHSGTTATDTTVNSGGVLYVSNGGVANSATVNSSGFLCVFSGGIANYVVWTPCVGLVLAYDGAVVTYASTYSGVYLGSNNKLLSSAAAMSGKILSGWWAAKCSMYVMSGGTAHSTTVNSDGNLYVSSGGMVNNTAVNSGGDLYVYSGGMANNTAVNSGGVLYVSSGGTATNIVASSGVHLGLTVASDTYIQGSYDGSAFEMKNAYISGYTVNSGYLFVSSNGTAHSTTVNSGGKLYVCSGGTANSTTINSNCDLYVSCGGMANSTIMSGCHLYVSSGGTVNDTDVYGYYEYYQGHALKCYGYLILTGGIANSTTVNDKGSFDVSSGGVANSTTILAHGRMHISSGGTAWAVRENGGYVDVADGADVTFEVHTFSGLDLWDSATIHSGTTVNHTQINQYGELFIYSGGVANDTKVYDGSTYHSGRLHILSGGMISGSLQIASGAVVSAYQGAIIDFTVAEQTAPETALINDWSRISGRNDAVYTLTVKADQAAGNYILAGGAADFAKTITVKNTVETLGSISLNSKLFTNGKIYSLVKQNGVLTLNVENMTPITITADSGSKMYDGTALSASGYTYTGTLLSGDTLEVTVSGSQTDAGIGVASVASYKVMRGETDVTGSYTFNESVNGTLTVTKRNVTLTTNSDSKMYDGTALQGSVEIGGDGFVTGEAAVSASNITDAGSVTNSAAINPGAGYKESNYNIMKSEGTLTVTKRNVTLTSADDRKVYDGTPLTNSTVTVSGDGFIAGESASYSVTGSQTEVGSSANSFDYTLDSNTKAQNYAISKVAGTLTVVPPAKSDLDGNGVSDVMFQYTGGDYQIGFWMNGTSTWQGTTASQPDNWKLLGNYDMDANGNADQVMFGNVVVNDVKGAYIGYYKDGDTSTNGWVTIGYLVNQEEIEWHNAIGNLTGNEGKNSIVWHAPELGACGVWIDGTNEWVGISGYFDNSWEMQGCGDFDGNGKDEILWKCGGVLYTSDIDGSFASLGTASGWDVRAIGDFSGDGSDDIVLFHSETGSVMKYEDGQASQWSSLGQLDASDWFIVGAGDCNGDAEDDLLVRQYSSGMLGYYESGDMSKWVELGRGVDMNWTVVA